MHLSAVQGLVFDIRKFSLHDGPGIRTTVFLKGCPLACRWCHNPESQSFQPELMLWEQRCIRCGECADGCPQRAIHPTEDEAGMVHFATDRSRCTRCGRCTEACPASARELAGRRMSVDEVVRVVEQDRPFYEESSGGVTVSGGEPLAQPAFLARLLQACQEQDLHTAVDTCGYAAWDVLEKIRPHTGLFLYDLKLMDDARHCLFTGVSNRRILENLRALSERGHRIIVRVPLVPGINDDEDNLRSLGAFTAGLPLVERVDVLPYHSSALGKYERLALPYALPSTRSPTPERLQEVVALLGQYDLAVKTGG
jgi:pyruvate formate lyase activating enzyme